MAKRFVAPLAAAALLGSADAGSLKDIDHVILFMQENRAFDHYFGTMAGVRGFADANVQMNGNRTVFKQVAAGLTKEADYVSPWYINYLGGEWKDATPCMYAGSNGWHENHAAWNHGTNDHWAVGNSPYSIGFYKRDDVPTHWALAENWVIGDMYQEAVVASTSPNRAFWASGSINVPGGPQRPNQGGNPYIDNNEHAGCEKGGINCYPLKWATIGEAYEAAGTTWSVYQDDDNFGDNPFAWFEQFQKADKGSSLHEKGMKGQSTDDFFRQLATGTLPEVSFYVGPAELSEHTPYSARDGAWLQNKIAQAVLDSPKYARTALIVSYDETGGWYDHLDPYRSPDGTPGEWLDDPYNQVGHTFAGPGFRVPFYIVSPFTRKGGVYTEHSDHSSQILFVEKWQEAKGRNVTTEQMVQWRRDNMGDLVNAFDFDNPDYSVPKLPDAPEPPRDDKGRPIGSVKCRAEHKNSQPPVPYTGDGVIEDMASVVEHGFKAVRGRLTEGRYLVFEMGYSALTHTPAKKRASSSLTTSRTTHQHEKEAQRWRIHAVELGGDDFTLESASGGVYICDDDSVCADESQATVFTLEFQAGTGYAFKNKGNGRWMVADGKGGVEYQGRPRHWKAYSVNY